MVKDVLGKLVEKPKYGGTFTYTTSVNYLGFDDLWTQYTRVHTEKVVCESMAIGNMLMGPRGTGETKFEHSGGPTPTKYYTGKLAESWEVPDATTSIWHLRKDVYWQNKAPVNGRQMTAEDVAFSIKRVYTEPPRSYYLVQSGAPPLSVEISKDDPWTVIVKCTPESAWDI